MDEVAELAHKTGHYPLWNKVKFVDQDPHWYMGCVKEAIHVRLHHNNRDNRVEILKVSMPTIKKHKKRTTLLQWTVERTVSHRYNED